MYDGLVKLDVNKYERFEKKIEELKKYIVDTSNSVENRTQAKARMMYYRRRFEYDQGSLMIFFTKGIKATYLKKFTGKYYRFALMIKLVLFELFVVSL